MPRRIQRDEHPNPLRSNPSFSPGRDPANSSRTRANPSARPTASSTHARQQRPSSDAIESSEDDDYYEDGEERETSEDNEDKTPAQSFEMAERPPYHRPNDGRSGTPLLAKDAEPEQERGRSRSKYGVRPPADTADDHHTSSLADDPTPLLAGGEDISRPHSTHTHFSSRQTLRSVSPASAAARNSSVRQKYTLAGFFLLLSLISFCVQTELAKIVQTDLGWNKAYCMLYLTHGSWSMLFPVQLLILRLQKLRVPWRSFWRAHWRDILTTAWEVQHQKLSHYHPHHHGHGHGGGATAQSPLAEGETTKVKRYIVRTTAIVTTSLTVAGLSWYIAVDMTSASDLTAIYNCSAFFAYAFSVPLLREPLRLDKSIAVLVAIAGVLVVAYGDSKPSAGTDDGQEGAKGGGEGQNRLVGNIIIGVGSVLYGLYEVLYKRMACPPEGAPAMRAVTFANAFGSCIGIFTLSVLWIPLPVLHFLGWEAFELPTGRTAWLLGLSVIMNATFAGSFLVLISLTSPVLSSVAALLTIFLVAVADWGVTGEPLSSASLGGGLLIVVAFGGLSWSTWREMSEHARTGDVDLESSDGGVEEGEELLEDEGGYGGRGEGERMLG